jgi:nucleoid-associated protein YgaU
MKIVNRKRFLASVVIFLMVILMSTHLAMSSFLGSETSPEDQKIYIVDQGDTLWDIAVKHKGEKDVRSYLYKIRKINDLSESDLQIGTKIKLP